MPVKENNYGAVISRVPIKRMDRGLRTHKLPNTLRVPVKRNNYEAVISRVPIKRMDRGLRTHKLPHTLRVPVKRNNNEGVLLTVIRTLLIVRKVIRVTYLDLGPPKDPSLP